MNLLSPLLAEVQADRTLLLSVALVATLALTWAFVAKGQRRTKGPLILYGLHLLLVPVAAGLRLMAPTSPSAADVHDDVRLGILILAALAAIGMLGQVVFEVVLPRMRLPAPRILRDLSVAGASLLATFAIASRMGINLSGIIATSAVVTAIIGFSL